MLQARAHGRKKQGDRKLREILARVLDATLLHRRAAMRYASASSSRTKEYVIEAQRIAYADGGIYVVAWVPEYGGLRTFAAERIHTFALLDDLFEPQALPLAPFADSLGVHTGRPETVVIEFDADAAGYVREREWHASQPIEDRNDGGLILTMTVCNDYALRAWVLGFGPSARVVAPQSLAQLVIAAVVETRRRYARARPAARAEMLSIRAS